MAGIVIAGAGQAGVECAFGLRAAGYAGEVTLIGAEPGLPGQRPPLSKSYLKSRGTEAPLPFRGAALYDRQRIGFLAGCALRGIDRGARRLALSDGRALDYDRLVLATGARNRVLPLPGFGPGEVLGLRDLADADMLIARLPGLRRLAVIGAGFIGLEVAAALAGSGIAVTVLEAGPRVMARAVSAEVSAWFERLHRGMGTDLRLGVEVARREPGAVVLADGTRIAADAVLVAAGVVPDTNLAAAAGLATGNGILTDDLHRSSDPAIFAIGDVAMAPNRWAADPVRLESVANATEQARRVAAHLAGKPVPDPAVPWFWSHQGAGRLQMAGLARPQDASRVIEDTGEVLVVERHRGGRLVALETVNALRLHMAARKAIAPERVPA
ncbi:NAD(P)/FAD-dependent oxidoreductase [Mangrovicoccus algicola]|uniref:FAD-dependent oxidoreductase n=1 Tax=Mangrovicoccus algicola TaxID=2771008 RepID=A0A8J6Z080_9RHOB|nr:FAD-dependent oxidoreductase [Mangrovicoccus algicola]MBE3639261.1 FAD-dependent oxidoreductase [Mangrovicoccus algicola]